MKRSRQRRRGRWSSVHRWLGLLLGAWFVLVGATGALLVYRDAVDAWLNPALFGPCSTAPMLDVQSIADRGTALGPVEKIRLPAAPGEVYRLQIRALASRVESGRIEALYCPASGELLGTRRLEGLSLAPPHLMRTLYEFHRNVLLGEPGSNIVGIAGFALMASVTTGLVIAWPRRGRGWARLVWINRRASATRVVFDLHRSSGAIIATVMLLSTLTGSTLVYLNYVRDLVSWFSRVEPFPVLPFRRTPPGERVTLATMAEGVRAAYPAHRISEIHIPPRATTGVLFYLRGARDEHRLGDTIAWVHPITAEVLVERSDRTRSGGETLMHWLLPLHVGSAFGAPGLALMCAAGIAPALLVATGLWVWLRKRRGERIGRERQRQREAAQGAGA